MKIQKLNIFFILLASMAVFSSCKKDYETPQEYDERRINDYIKSSSIQNALKDASGYYYSISNIGNGGIITHADSVLFTLKLTNIAGKSYFQTPDLSNSGDYVGYLVNSPEREMVPGLAYPKEVFKSALTKVQRGGTIKVIIPSYLAYGTNGNSIVPENEILVAEINVLKEKSQAELDENRIKAFLTKNNITATRHSNGAYYQVLNEGTTGLSASLTLIIKTKYKARLFDGYLFDQTLGDNVYETELNNTRYFGIKKILEGRKAGTKLRIFLPSSLALGAYSSYDVPKNTPLDIEVEIVEVVDDYPPASE